MSIVEGRMQEEMEVLLAMETTKRQDGGKVLELGGGLEYLNVFFKDQREWSLKGLWEWW